MNTQTITAADIKVSSNPSPDNPTVLQVTASVMLHEMIQVRPCEVARNPAVLYAAEADARANLAKRLYGPVTTHAEALSVALRKTGLDDHEFKKLSDLLQPLMEMEYNASHPA